MPDQIETMYNFDTSASLISRELYTNVGSSKFQVGTAARAFKSDLEIWDSATGGTQLIIDVDYEIDDIDQDATVRAGYDAYTRVKVLNATYQTGNIYITYNAVVSYPDAAYFNDLRDDVDALGGSSPKTLTNADSPYVIIDTETFSDYDCDTSSGNIVITLPTLSDNYNKKLTITHNIQGSTNTVTINPEGSDNLTQDALTSIELAKEGDYVEIYGSQQAGAWIFRNERISCQLRLNTYTGYGSTDNKIMRFTNSVENYGNCFSENHSTGYNSNTEGLEITINRSGKYLLSFSGASSAVTSHILGLSINSSQLTTVFQSINVADRLASDQAAAGSRASLSINMYLLKNDIIRPHTSGIVPTDSSSCCFIAAYAGN